MMNIYLVYLYFIFQVVTFSPTAVAKDFADLDEKTHYLISLGSVIDAFNKYAIDEKSSSPFGIKDPVIAFNTQYESTVKYLPVNLRVNFFMSYLWHVFPTAGYLSEFEMTVFNDCPTEFIEKISSIVEGDSSRVDTRKIKLLKGVKRDLSFMLSRKDNKQ